MVTQVLKGNFLAIGIIDVNKRLLDNIGLNQHQRTVNIVDKMINNVENPIKKRFNAVNLAHGKDLIEIQAEDLLYRSTIV